MDTNKEEIHLDRDEARAGSTPGVARYVLAISLVLVIIAFAVIVMTGAFSSNQHNNAQESSQKAVAEENAKQ
jgi:flagellar basal body-associated protein FliL